MCEERVRLGDEFILFLEFFVVSWSTLFVFLAVSDNLRLSRVATPTEEEDVVAAPEHGGDFGGWLGEKEGAAASGTSGGSSGDEDGNVGEEELDVRRWVCGPGRVLSHVRKVGDIGGGAGGQLVKRGDTLQLLLASPRGYTLMYVADLLVWFSAACKYLCVEGSLLAFNMFCVTHNDDRTLPKLHTLRAHAVDTAYTVSGVTAVRDDTFLASGRALLRYR